MEDWSNFEIVGCESHSIDSNILKLWGLIIMQKGWQNFEIVVFNNDAG